MIGTGPAVSDIKKEIKGSGCINIEWTFMDARKIYKVSAYKVSFDKYVSYTVNVFKNGKNVAIFEGPGKARKLIDHAMAVVQKKSR